MYKVPKVRIPEIPRSLINHIQSSNKNVLRRQSESISPKVPNERLTNDYKTKHHREFSRLEERFGDKINSRIYVYFEVWD